MRKNAFLLKYGYGAIDDFYQTTITYHKFTPDNDEGFNEYITQQLLAMSCFPSHSKALGKAILTNIFEFFENARTHGSCEYIHTCGQFFPKKPDKPLHFTIVDKGINIQQNVRDYLKKDIKADEAIK
jgi:hypothetical protein